jgi:hypothetical protein
VEANGVAKRLPPSLLALGRESFPACVEIDGKTYELVHPLKHDFFAATALYAGPAGAIVVKFGRRASFLGLPLGWIGRFLARREARFYRELADLKVVPKFIGTWGDAAFAHAYVEGHALRKGERVADDFFDRLREALAVIHERGMAYVDLEKCDNVLVGDDGKPYLVDFQVSWRRPRGWAGRVPPARWLLRILQQADQYHLQKLQRRTRPDQLTARELTESYRRPLYVHLHRWITRPGQQLRRGVLNRLDPARNGRKRDRIPDEPAGPVGSTRPPGRSP